MGQTWGHVQEVGELRCALKTVYAALQACRNGGGVDGGGADGGGGDGGGSQPSSSDARAHRSNARDRTRALRTQLQAADEAAAQNEEWFQRLVGLEPELSSLDNLQQQNAELQAALQSVQREGRCNAQQRGRAERPCREASRAAVQRG